MKRSLIAAVVLAGAGLGATPAMAQDVIGDSPQALNLVDLTAYFGDTFAADNEGNTFADRFTFTIDSTIGHDLDAVVASISRRGDVGLDITGLALYGADDALIADGEELESGAFDLWTIASDNLAAGDYYLQVSGELVSDAGASFGGAVALAPVPEPETYGLMLGGLGVLGFLAHRRRTRSPRGRRLFGPNCRETGIV